MEDTKPTAPERTPPNDQAAEQAVLGAALLAADRVMPIACALATDDFFQTYHREAWAAILSTFERRMPVDTISVGDEVKARGMGARFPDGWASWASSTIGAVSSVDNVGHYVKIVAEKSALRKLINLSAEVASAAYASQAFETVMGMAREGIGKLEVLGIRGGPEKIGGLLGGALEVISGRMTGKIASSISSGIGELDDITGGFKPARLYFVAGRPGDGKTSLQRTVALNVVEAGYDVIAFSRETPNQESIECNLSMRSKIPAIKITAGRLNYEEFQKIQQAANGLYEAKLWLDDRSSTIEKICAETRKWHALNVKGRKGGSGLGLMILDYLQLTRVARARSGSNREQVVAEMSGALKQLAMDLNIPVMVLSQLNREAEKRGGRPMPMDLRESGSLEQDADLIIFVYRDIPVEDKKARNLPGPAELIVGKHRGGPTGIANVYFDTLIMQWRDRDGYIPEPPVSWNTKGDF
jgi:replicative DNA helicase